MINMFEVNETRHSSSVYVAGRRIARAFTGLAQQGTGQGRVPQPCCCLMVPRFCHAASVEIQTASLC